MQILTITARLLWCVATATAYKLTTLPLTVAGFFVVPFVIWRAEWHTSPLTGERIFGVPSGPLFLWSNAQDGLDPPWAVESIYKGWPTFWRRYSWAAWRNSIRNLPFVPWLSWLHLPKGELRVTEWTWRGARFRIRARGWMTEFEYFTAKRFGDFGPRLDQPDAWGAVSWAFRIAGRL
jgi:hypothetical protein